MYILKPVRNIAVMTNQTVNISAIKLKWKITMAKKISNLTKLTL